MFISRIYQVRELFTMAEKEKYNAIAGKHNSNCLMPVIRFSL